MEKTEISMFPNVVRHNLRAFRKKAGMTHKQVAEALSQLIECSPLHTTSQSNETGDSLSYTRLAALAIIFGTDPAHFFMTEPPDLREDFGHNGEQAGA